MCRPDFIEIATSIMIIYCVLARLCSKITIFTIDCNVSAMKNYPGRRLFQCEFFRLEPKHLEPRLEKKIYPLFTVESTHSTVNKNITTNSMFIEPCACINPALKGHPSGGPSHLSEERSRDVTPALPCDDVPHIITDK